MSSAVTLPLWIVVIAVALASLAAVNHFFLPAIRWVLRRRLNKVINDVNKRLRLSLPTFQLTKRQVLIDRLTYDPQVMKAVAATADERGETRDAVMAEVVIYAREMVPAFNPYFYFRVGYRLARRTLRMLYRVRLGFAHKEALAEIPPGTSIVFFVNHRSNFDYLLVTYLASGSAALSYGAGEWARVWPFRTILRLAGAYILRRDTTDPLYRMVLQRYVQMATEAGVPHAIFGEGQLSRNGKVNAPKLGMLGYITKRFDPEGPYDILFIPVGTNFDRVAEERTLIANVDTDFRGRGTVFVLGNTVYFIGQQLWRKVNGRWRGFGVASANFGQPLSLRKWSRDHGIEFHKLGKDQLFDAVSALGNELTNRIIGVVPVLAVPVISLVLLESDAPLSSDGLKGRTREILDEFRDLGAHIAIEAGQEDAAIDDGLELMIGRRLIVPDGVNQLTIAEGERDLLTYYANSVTQLRSQLQQR